MRTYSMFHKPAKLLAAGGLLFAALLAGQTAFAQTIVGSRHDLTTTGTGSIKQTTTAEICVFCHTPHGASAVGPLWNKATSGGAFTYYASPTMDSTALVATGSTSAMCLSCHDGVSSVDNLINKPGSGGYTAGGALAGYTYTGGVTTLAGSGIRNIGADLSNDHPIGVAWCGGFTAGACRDADFKIAALNRKVGAVTTTGTTAATTGGALTDTYWIDVTAGGTASVRDKTDMILYTRAFAAPAGNFPSVECASCHEPHNPVNGTFLRTTNAASALCTACHSK